MLLLLLILPGVLGLCSDKRTCGDCMENPECVWCSDPSLFASTTPRCSERSAGLSCESPVDVESFIEITENLSLSMDSDETQFVKIQPQAVSAFLRPGKPVNISFSIGNAKNYPVDLYFLMDLSWSMRSSRDKLISAGGDIIATIKNKTSDVNIGFGSFVEKNLPPFTSSIPEFNCEVGNPDCAPPYSFYHRQNLADITAQQFSKAVMEAPLAGNVDEPEGSLDALMQVMACTDRIGWRSTSRKIIILFTDRDFHFAMDGKLAGVLEPNDGKCHLNNTENGSGYYTMGEFQDYPSISHINSVAQENFFILLFAVDEKYKDIYQALVDRIPGSSVDVLSKDGSNIVHIVETKYEEISTSILMRAETSGSGSTFKFFSSCGFSGDVYQTNNCTNIQLGDIVHFTVEVSIEDCDVEPQSIPIYSIGLNEHNLVISLYPSCACPCETSSTLEPSALCSGEGGLVCGECSCNPGHYGRICECDGKSENEGEGQCKAEPSAPVCSGRGDCNCGVCSCSPSRFGLVSGIHCECDNWTCPKDKDGNLCSGNGDCICGSCSCKSGWSGEACGCNEMKVPCISPYDGEVCSGNGECLCGKCRCKPIESGALYTGEYCEKNPTASAGVEVCGEVRNCVECQHFPDSNNQENCSNCVFQSNTVEISDLVGSYEKVCSYENQNGCSYSFIIDLDDRGEAIVNLVTKDGNKEECAPLGLQLGIGAGVLVFILGILTLIIYKLCIEINDRREYARFESNRAKNAGNLMPNEIYKSPITTFSNPTFGRG